jgi:hypothetical protein
MEDSFILGKKFKESSILISMKYMLTTKILSFFSNFLNNPCWTCKKSFHSIYKVNESAIPLSMMR